MLLLATLLLPPAFAESPDAASDVPELVDTPDGPRRITWKRVTEIDMGEQAVEGTLYRPEGAVLSEARRPPHQPQIRLRANFDDLTLDSVDLVR